MRSDRAARWLAFVVACAASGCAATILPASAVDAQGGIADDLEFWQQLENEAVLTNHDALHGLFLLADGTDEARNWVARREQAIARGWIAAGDSLEPNEAARVGMVSVAVCDILHLDGGVVLRTFGRSQRYCTRELVFARLLPARTPQQILRGPEFVDLAGRIEDYQKKHAAVDTGGGR